MSFNEDYNDAHQTEKIPFDDTPIVRIPQDKRNVSFFNRAKTTSQKKPTSFKVLVACVAILIVVNIVLSGLVIWNITHGGTRNINVYQNSINASEGTISAYAFQTARFSSVCVSASDMSISSNTTFFVNARSRGSGVIYKKDEDEGIAYILTCYHVIQGYEDKNIYVLFTGVAKPKKATVVGKVGYSEDYDIAVLRVEDLRNLEACLPIQIQDSHSLVFGEDVFAVGNALSGNLGLTGGRISNINKQISVDGYIRRELQFDAAINPGNSGGGLFDAEGKFIGLVNAKLNSTTSGNTNITVEGTAYAIPGNLAVSIAESIIQNKGKPTTIKLDVEFTHDLDAPMSPYKDTNIDSYRVIVGQVKPGSIASNLLRKNDEIDSFEYISIRDGQSHKVIMYNMYCFEDVGFEITKGSTIVFNVKRGDSEEIIQVQVNASALYTPN